LHTKIYYDERYVKAFHKRKHKYGVKL